MPKRVDHEERRRRIAEALWRIASTRGLDGVSLRDVAAEAGISLGQLQHYFATKDEMLVFSLDHISELATARVRDRILALAHTPSAREIIRETIAEMLPRDANSRTGLLVQLAYFVRAVHDERMARHAQQGVPALAGFFADQIRAAIERGEVAADRDPHTEAMLLIAMADGLSGYALMDVCSVGEALRLADAQLERLFSGR
ncbi:TetR family transcriptional regulator C-terminal domain-containing protein [Streptomyces sp. NPDC049577]|uniref:TetR/AcrR family transcriptional regulator n=1 Tax=Streptomyces sp. NPDC049577 TaxID=3155153 RepID=UPI00342E3344